MSCPIKKVAISLACFIYASLSREAPKNKSLIYILKYHLPTEVPLNHMTEGQSAFIQRSCEYQNCFVTSNRSYFDSIEEFDVLIFNVVQLHTNHRMPPRSQRSVEQEYIFLGIEPAYYFSIPESEVNGRFNLTWTYKLSSDIPYPSVLVRDKNGTIVGPKEEMHWIDIKDMKPIDESVKSKLKNKVKAAMWVATNCETKTQLMFIDRINYELNKFNKEITIHGDCGIACHNCMSEIQPEYYFYMAFENSFSEDYVSERILYALQNYAVPIVLGGANYTRFMPNGIYLNALELGAKKLAKEMNDIMNSRSRYESFFKWHSHYSFHSVTEKDHKYPVCELCAFLNNKAHRKYKGYSKLSFWWNKQGVWEDFMTKTVFSKFATDDDYEFTTDDHYDDEFITDNPKIGPKEEIKEEEESFYRYIESLFA